MEHKYRGMRIDNGEEVKGYYWCNKESNKHYIRRMNFQPAETDYTDYEVHPDSVSMWTGLKDKKDIEIYEGDWIVQIFEIDLGGSPEEEHVEYDEFEGVVMWENCGFVIDTKGDGKPEVDLSEYAYRLEILGNIHEDGGLLND